MRLFSYVVARDYGFAPNPFYGFCSLATCKPRIRNTARAGDYVVGTGSKAHGAHGRLVYAMRVSETLTYSQFWHDPRFRPKRPNLRGSLKQAYGDNIYHRGAGGEWVQIDSHHSLPSGAPNVHNILNDTQSDRVLIAEEYAYWGHAGPRIDQRFRDYGGDDVCAGRNHRSNFRGNLVAEFLDWLGNLDACGYIGEPTDWPKGL